MTRTLNAVTGPSGAGKSAFCKQQPDWEHRLYNLDDWARRLGHVDNPAVRESAWGALVKGIVSDMREGFSPITLDHVFESRTIEEVVNPAKALGYRVCLWVVCPDNPGTCVERVRKRQEEGGHGRSARTVRELYGSALHVASEMSIECHETRLIDSSSSDGFQFISSIREFRTTITAHPTPGWVRKHFLDNGG